MSSHRAVFIASAVLLTTFGCSSTEPAAPTAEPTATQAAPQATKAQATKAQADNAREHAPFQVEGDVVKVNNRFCAVSRGEMSPDALGDFVSRVAYAGDDPRFKGKTMVFNQCCNGCVARFPALWADHPDEILAFHGLGPAR